MRRKLDDISIEMIRMNVNGYMGKRSTSGEKRSKMTTANINDIVKIKVCKMMKYTYE